MKTVFYLLFFITMVPVKAIAVSFTADAVQIRDGEFSHARMYWTDNQVRFEYLDQGVAMVQIYDISNNKTIWLDTENKVFLERELSDTNKKQKVVKSSVIKNPCDLSSEAQCTRLKEVTVNGRDTIKWLVTLPLKEGDKHIFQWLDKKYGVVVKQENPDGTFLNTTIEDDLDVNGRKARKIDMRAVSQSGVSMRNVQWYDSELDIIVRQTFADGDLDELRNIKVEKVSSSLFKIPKGYAEVEQPVDDQSTVASQPEDIKRTETKTN